MPDIRETGKLYCIEDAHTRSNTIWNVHDEDVNIMSVAVGRHSQGYQCYGFLILYYAYPILLSQCFIRVCFIFWFTFFPQ